MNIIVTGAGKGIGFELVRCFMKDEENSVFAVSRDISRLLELKNNLNPVINSRLVPMKFDITEMNFPDKVIPELGKTAGKINILINNAAYLFNHEFASYSRQDFDKTFNTNVRSPFFLIQSLIPFFDEPSHIVNITSMGGYQGSSKFPGLAAYSASKAALACLTECLAEELKERRIFVNALALGAVQTEMLENAFPGYKAPVSAQEMAQFISDFARQGHRFFNGKVLPVTTSNP